MPNPAIPEWLQAKREHLSAQDLLNRFRMTKPPIDVYLLAQLLETELILVDNADFAGAIEVNMNPYQAYEAKISVNASDADVRKRFTIAHEIGHLILHDLTSGVLRRDTDFRDNSPLERQANGYASKLLMPEWILDSIVEHYRYNSEILAAVFDVSVPAMVIRLKKLYGI